MLGQHFASDITNLKYAGYIATSSHEGIYM
jgi:hypothetical protein